MALDCMPIMVPFMKFMPKYAAQMHTMNAISPVAPTRKQATMDTQEMPMPAR